MFKRELKINFKSFFIWLLVLILLFGCVFLMYPSIMDSENVQMMDEMMKIFPEEVLKALNMDIASMKSAFGWIKTEGFVFVLIITGIYSGILGSNILLKEESEKTIEYLNSVPVKRKTIVLNKVICGLIYITLMVGIMAIFNFIGLRMCEDFDEKSYWLLSITPLFSSLVIFALCLFISTFTHKIKKVNGISFAIVFVSYFMQVVSQMSEKAEVLKYFSVFTLADVRNVILNIEINSIMPILSIGLTVLFIILTLIRYEKKELV